MFNMYDYPELFQQMMGQIADDTLAYYRMLEEKKLILPTTAFENVGQGTFAFTRDLPGEEVLRERPFTTKDVWGFMDSQETVGISPQMYEEFIFPCYQKISSQYGLLSYGCCEPVHRSGRGVSVSWRICARYPFRRGVMKPIWENS